MSGIVGFHLGVAQRALLAVLMRHVALKVHKSRQVMEITELGRAATNKGNAFRARHVTASEALLNVGKRDAAAKAPPLEWRHLDSRRKLY